MAERAVSRLGIDFRADLTGKAAIVTGAGTGIGRAIALALGRSGAAVAVNDLSPDHADAVAEDIRAGGGRAFDWTGDTANRFQASALIEKARDEFGRIHLFFHAATVYKPGAFAQTDEWDWRRQLEVNLTSAFFCTQLIGRVMADDGGGSIVHLAAPAITLGAGGAAYAASKAGLIALTRQAARELAPANIRVNALCPANIEGTAAPPARANALNRLGTPDEVAAAALFLCSDAASFITGQALTVDGAALD